MSVIRNEKTSDEHVLFLAGDNAITGGYDKSRYLYYQIKFSISKSVRIDIIVSFLMESGVKLIINDLKKALNRGVSIRILTGNYLGITQPSALYLIKKGLQDRVDIRLYNDPDRSFHPKAYIFHYEKDSEIYVGSSNISASALTSGIEWNYRLNSNRDPEGYQSFCRTFEDLFHHHSIIIDDQFLKTYAANWHRPSIVKDLERFGEIDKSKKTVKFYEPRGAQIEALFALQASREEGATKGLVHAATGVGKTYLAAFDSKEYKTVLFVAHREEILKQAAVSFKNVRESEDYGFFNGDNKDIDRSVIFASVASLGQERYLMSEYFAPDYFEYIVVDEFHHAVTDQYKRIIQYFHPKFLLGLTATPERMDGRDIYELCDYNVPYEISLKTAINRGVLVPFHYYGIYDDTDYSKLHLVRGRYDEKELNETYIGNVRRFDLIYRNYCKYKSERALGFCCSIKHAEAMAEDFVKKGIPAVAVHSGSYTAGQYCCDRATAIEKLVKGEIKVIFSVDMFNEGIDIPSTDMVLFLRPTESPVVFLQQLGRGLRKDRGKSYLKVLDFIGNYEKAGRAPFLLAEKPYERGRTGTGGMVTEDDYPDDCIVDFDLQLIDLFKQMEQRGQTIRDLIRNEYQHVKEMLGHVPSRMELFSRMDDSVYQLCRRTSKENLFRNYLDFLKKQNDLTLEQEELYQGIGKEFINLLEQTSMSKSYKMPILLAFYNDGMVRMEITDDQVLEAWKRFFSTGTNWKDLTGAKTLEDYKRITDKDHLSNAKKNPIHFLTKSGKGFFVTKDGYALALNEQLESVIRQNCFIEQMGDTIKYRTMEYYRSRYSN